MMRNILKIIFVFIFAFFLTPFSSAYNSDQLKTFSIDSPNVWTSLYNIPEDKDLIINEILSSDVNEQISIRNTSTGSQIVVINNDKQYLGEPFVIKDELQIIANPGTNVNILVNGFLVSEDEDVTNYLQGNNTAWNKHIFDKKDIDFIYFREFIIFFFLVIIKFFSIVIGRNVNIF